eukprot:TRINITY_DN6964_c0_g1_i1.p1 TRINITY_DN6964_c0_g1~~TRINITY_DN6964_c0_g1_i1.p1  ORF type:complete len:203 (+),score=40.30 TRINITY_DN6964_c0_g1_i1:148-756(+)
MLRRCITKNFTHLNILSICSTKYQYSTNKKKKFIVGVHNNLKNYPHQVKVDISWGLMDAFKHLNNVHYYRFFENCRIKQLEYLSKHSENKDFLEAKLIGPIITHQECYYKGQCKYPDTITVGSRIIKSKDDTEYTEEYSMVSHQSGRVIATGTGTIVCVDYIKSKKISFPESILKLINEQIEITEENKIKEKEELEELNRSD